MPACRPLPALSLLLVLGLPPRPAFSQDLSLATLLEQNAKAMGGRARLDSLRSVVTLRTPTSITSLKLPCFVLVEGFDSLGRIRYAEGHDGHQTWEQTGTDAVRRLVTGRAEAALRRVVQWPNNLLPLYRVGEYGGRLTLEGREVRDGIAYYRLRLTLPDGFERWYFIDPSTYRISWARDTRELHANDGNTRPIETVFSDYREVQGYWFPFTVYERDARTGERLAGRTMLGIFPNDPVPDSAFGAHATSDPARLRQYLARLGR
jgi:hypothetical protein